LGLKPLNYLRKILRIWQEGKRPSAIFMPCSNGNIHVVDEWFARLIMCHVAHIPTHWGGKKGR
jgi:hypothetical protein